LWQQLTIRSLATIETYRCANLKSPAAGSNFTPINDKYLSKLSTNNTTECVAKTGNDVRFARLCDSQAMRITVHP
jgi:hypothetical protein